VKLRHYAMLGIGLVWLFADIWFIESNIILRETRFGTVAGYIDKFPLKLGNLTFLALWIGLLSGWAILIGLGLKPFLRKRN
jgi:hypothetical protein